MPWLPIHILTINMFVCLNFMCRTYVCNFFDYAYVHVRVSKEVGKDWNNCFIAVIPFLCGLTLELSHHLCSICVLESSSKLLFQQNMDDVKQVRSFMPYYVSSFLHIKPAHFPYRPKYQTLSRDFILSSRRSKLAIVSKFLLGCF